jgi:hypothetical protein
MSLCCDTHYSKLHVKIWFHIYEITKKKNLVQHQWSTKIIQNISVLKMLHLKLWKDVQYSIIYQLSF